MSMRGMVFESWSRRIGRRVAVTLAAVLAIAGLISVLPAPAAYAAETNHVTLTVSQSLAGDALASQTGGKFTYRLTPGTASAPMPSGGDGSGFAFDITGTAEGQVGPIHYNDTGVYEYTLKCMTASGGGFTVDGQTYKITVFAASGIAPVTTVSSGDGSKASEIAFNHIYKKPLGGGGNGGGNGGEPGNPGGTVDPGSPGGTVDPPAGGGGGTGPGTVDPPVAPVAPQNPGGSSPGVGGTAEAPPAGPGPGAGAGAGVGASTVQPAQPEVQPPDEIDAAPEPDAPAPPAPPPSTGPVWSLISGVMSVLAAVNAVLLIRSVYTRKKKCENYEGRLEALGLLTEERRNELDSICRSGRTLKIFAILTGVVTPVVWLLFDLPLVNMVEFDRSTPWTALVFAGTMALTIAFNIRKKKAEQDKH